MSLEDRIRVERDNNALLYELLKLRWLVGKQRSLLLKLPPGEIGMAPDQLHEQCQKVEDLVENMQASCVVLPDPNERYSSCRTWEVPVKIGYPPSLLSECPRDFSSARFHRIMFEKDAVWHDDGPRTWFWRLRAQDLDTGIKVKPR